MPRSDIRLAIATAPMFLAIAGGIAGCNILLDIGGPEDYQIAGASSSSGASGGGGADAGAGPRIECIALATFGDDASQLNIESVSSDFDGNIYLAGTFVNQVSFGAGVLSSNGAEDAVIVKLNPQLEPIWNQNYGAATGEFGTIVLAADDRVYFGGAYDGTSISFDAFNVQDPDNNDGVEDAFMVAFSPVGTPLWANYCGSNSNGYQHRCSDFDLDVLKNVIHSQIGDSGKSFSARQASPDGTDSGMFMSTRSMVGLLGGTALVENTLIRAGEYNQDIDWDSIGSCYMTETSGQAYDIFLQARKINCTDCSANCSDHVWQKKAGDIQAQHFGDIAADNGVQSGQKGAVLTGYFEGTLNFGMTPLASKGQTDIFVTKIDPLTGGELWSKSFGDAGPQESKAIAIKDGRIYLGGHFQGTMDWMPSQSGAISAEDQDVFVALLDSKTGEPLLGASFGGAGVQSVKDMDIDPDRNIILIGTFNTSIDFGCAGGPLNNGGAAPKPFVAKLKVTGL